MINQELSNHSVNRSPLRSSTKKRKYEQVFSPSPKNIGKENAKEIKTAKGKKRRKVVVEIDKSMLLKDDQLQVLSKVKEIHSFDKSPQALRSSPRLSSRTSKSILLNFKNSTKYENENTNQLESGKRVMPQISEQTSAVVKAIINKSK